MALTFKILMGLVSIVALTCLAIFLFQLRKVRNAALYRLVAPDYRLSAWYKAYFLLILVAFMVVSYKGAEGMLFWVPASWGHIDEDGDFQQTRTLLALVLGGTGGLRSPTSSPSPLSSNLTITS